MLRAVPVGVGGVGDGGDPGAVAEALAADLRLVLLGLDVGGPGKPHGPEHQRDAHAVGRGLDLKVAKARPLDLLLLDEQLAADEQADAPAHLERADRSAGGGNRKLGHGLGGRLLEAIGGDDPAQPPRIGAMVEVGAGIGMARPVRQ